MFANAKALRISTQLYKVMHQLQLLITEMSSSPSELIDNLIMAAVDSQCNC